MRKIALTLGVLGVAFALLARNYDYDPSMDEGSIPVLDPNSSLASYTPEKDAPYSGETQHRGGSRRPISVVGTSARIPEPFWVDVMNSRSVVQVYSNGSKMLSKGDLCILQYGGTITVIKSNGEDLLVEYSPPGEPDGTACPEGVQFVTTMTKFKGMTSKYESIRDAKQAEKALVKKLLTQNIHGEFLDAGTWRWVDVMNIDPVVQKYQNGLVYLSYGDMCGLGSTELGDGFSMLGGTIEFRGSENGKMLYEYHAIGEPYGTSCSSGVLFFDR